MPNKEYTLTMARYNLWKMKTCYQPRMGFPRLSVTRIQKTLSHLFWGDMLWMSRFAGTVAPRGGITETTEMISSWHSYRADRKTFDARIMRWAHEVTPDWFEGELTWFSGAIGCEITKPKSTLVIQFFNHQTHHRGQVHAMLTSAGARPGDTDVPFMPEQYLDL